MIEENILVTAEYDRNHKSETLTKTPIFPYKVLGNVLHSDFLRLNIYVFSHSITLKTKQYFLHHLFVGYSIIPFKIKTVYIFCYFPKHI